MNIQQLVSLLNENLDSGHFGADDEVVLPTCYWHAEQHSITQVFLQGDGVLVVQADCEYSR